MFERLRSLIRPEGNGSDDLAEHAGREGLYGQAAARGGASDGDTVRNSNGLSQFFETLRDRDSLRLLDLSGASQANVQFITNMGHRLTSDDFLRTMDSIFGTSDPYGNQADPDRAAAYRKQALDYPMAYFDGVLVWDTLQYLSPQLLSYTVDKLHSILVPGACLMTMFSANDKLSDVPLYTYRIVDSKTLRLTQRGMRPPAQYFNNRAIEKMFVGFDSVKFFLTRDHLREIIVRR